MPAGGTWSAAAIKAALGMIPGPGDAEVTYTGISTDSRAISPGALFVALQGERFDGHDYLPAVAKAAAKGAIVRRGTAAVPPLEFLEVDEPLRAFGLLARARRRPMSGPVIAVTGTNGKTSTKQMLAAVLSTRYRSYAARANLNNLVGAPPTILEAPSNTEALIVEAGA